MNKNKSSTFVENNILYKKVICVTSAKLTATKLQKFKVLEKIEVDEWDILVKKKVFLGLQSSVNFSDIIDSSFFIENLFFKFKNQQSCSIITSLMNMDNK